MKNIEATSEADINNIVIPALENENIKVVLKNEFDTVVENMWLTLNYKGNNIEIACYIGNSAQTLIDMLEFNEDFPFL